MTTGHDPLSREPSGRKDTPRSIFWTGFILGVGIMAFLDETLLHQLLQWHTLYWNTDQHGRILSDGLFHAFSTLLLLWGAFRLWRVQSNWTQPSRNAIIAALFIGAGGFNLYDGLVQHLLLRLHIVNELVCSSPSSRTGAFLVCVPPIYLMNWFLTSLLLCSCVSAFSGGVIFLLRDPPRAYIRHLPVAQTNERKGYACNNTSETCAKHQ